MFRSSFRLLSCLIAAAPLVALNTNAVAQDTMSFGNSQGAPPVPLNLSITQKKTKNDVEVNWNNVSAPDVIEFHVFRLENYSPDTTLKTVGIVPRYANTGKTLQFIDTTSLPSRTYTYFVTSKDRFGTQSANSKLATVTTHPPIPPPASR